MYKHRGISTFGAFHSVQFCGVNIRVFFLSKKKISLDIILYLNEKWPFL